MKKAFNVFLLVTVISSALMGGYMFICRFMHLTNGFQYDELYSIATATPGIGFSVIWHDMLLRDINLPLFNILLLGWNHFFPITPVYTHLFSALLGALAVIVAWLLAPKSWPKLKTFIFVMLMAGNFILVAYGTNVRSYSLSVLLSTCFTLLALRFIEQFEKNEKISVWQWLSFLTAGLLGSYSHYFCAAVFFIAALVVFLYACYYRQGRAWSFWGTAVVFFAWLPWVLFALGIMGGATPGAEGATDWWYHTPFLVATRDVLTFLFGPPWILCGLLIVGVIVIVSLIASVGKKIIRMPDFIVPLAQILLLCIVLDVVGLRFNLWMDRYFLPLLPPVFVLFAGALYHLYTRHKIFIVLLPVLLFGWMQFYWGLEYVHASEYTGLHDAFDYLTSPEGPKAVLVDRAKVGYPEKALDIMLAYYVPKDSKLKLIPLTAETAPLAYTSEPKIPILMMLCSQVHLIYTTIDMKIEEDGHPRVFGNDTCLFTAHQLHPQKAARVAARKEN